MHHNYFRKVKKSQEQPANGQMEEHMGGDEEEDSGDVELASSDEVIV